jgi:hypothetical protein
LCAPIVSPLAFTLSLSLSLSLSLLSDVLFVVVVVFVAAVGLRSSHRTPSAFSFSLLTVAISGRPFVRAASELLLFLPQPTNRGIELLPPPPPQNPNREPLPTDRDREKVQERDASLLLCCVIFSLLLRSNHEGEKEEGCRGASKSEGLHQPGGKLPLGRYSSSSCGFSLGLWQGGFLSLG